MTSTLPTSVSSPAPRRRSSPSSKSTAVSSATASRGRSRGTSPDGSISSRGSRHFPLSLWERAGVRVLLSLFRRAPERHGDLVLLLQVSMGDAGVGILGKLLAHRLKRLDRRLLLT